MKKNITTQVFKKKERRRRKKEKEREKNLFAAH
jgi:hypothetical protein